MANISGLKCLPQTTYKGLIPVMGCGLTLRLCWGCYLVSQNEEQPKAPHKYDEVLLEGVQPVCFSVKMNVSVPGCQTRTQLCGRLNGGVSEVRPVVLQRAQLLAFCVFAVSIAFIRGSVLKELILLPHSDLFSGTENHTGEMCS